MSRYRMPRQPISMTTRISPEMLAVLFDLTDLRRRVLSLQPATQATIDGYRQRVVTDFERRLREKFPS